MASWRPTPADLRAWLDRSDRAERKFKFWRNEYSVYRGLYSMDDQAWARVAPGSSNIVGRPETQTVVRNGIAENVWMDVRRLVFKNPRFTSVPESSAIQVRGTPVDGNAAAYAQGEFASFGFRRIGFVDTLTPVVEDGKIANEGWVKLVFPSGPDSESTPVWPGPDTQTADGEKTSRGRIGPHAPTSLATHRFPDYVWVDVDDVVCDPDAVLWKQVNWVRHRLKNPLSTMKSQTVDDPDGEIDPQTGEIRKIAKYENLEGLKGNLSWHKENEGKTKGDPVNDSWRETDHDPDDYLVYEEFEFKLPADSEFVKKDFDGRIPSTINGYVYYLMDIVSASGQAKLADPICIRFHRQRVDLGGFSLVRWQPRKKSGSQKGYSAIRLSYEANTYENYALSYQLHHLAATKTVGIADATVIHPDEINRRKEADFNDILMATPAGGKDIRQGLFFPETPSLPPEAVGVAQSMRAISDEAYGRGPNQRGIYSGAGASATEAQIVKQTTDDQIAYEEETLKLFTEDCARIWVRAARATLRPDGLWEIPGSRGGHVKFETNMLFLECAFELDYASLFHQDNPVKRKELEGFLTQIRTTPPQLWRQMLPLWRYQATTYSPGLLAAYREWEKEFLAGQRGDTSPDVEHLEMREGRKVEPDPNEDFVTNIPLHQKWLAQVTTDPAMRGWAEPAGDRGLVPVDVLAEHIQVSLNKATERGLGPMLGIQQGVQGARTRGSGVGAGRLPQGVPNAGELESASENIGQIGIGGER